MSRLPSTTSLGSGGNNRVVKYPDNPFLLCRGPVGSVGTRGIRGVVQCGVFLYSVHDDVEGHRGSVLCLQSPGRTVRPSRDRCHLQHALRHHRPVGQQLDARSRPRSTTGHRGRPPGRRVGGVPAAGGPGAGQGAPVATHPTADSPSYACRHSPTPMDRRLLPLRLCARSVHHHHVFRHIGHYCRRRHHMNRVSS